jgi:ribonuclease P protein component
MLSRRTRISRQDFSLISGDKTAKRAASPHFSAVISAAGSGIAVVVPKKVSKTAVGRHLLKRRVRAVLRPWFLHTLSAMPSDTVARAVIVFARAGADSLTFPELSAELTELLRRVA